MRARRSNWIPRSASRRRSPESRWCRARTARRCASTALSPRMISPPPGSRSEPGASLPSSVPSHRASRFRAARWPRFRPTISGPRGNGPSGSSSPMLTAPSARHASCSMSAAKLENKGESAMNKARQLLLAGALIVSFAWAAPAMAVTSTRVVITEDQEEVPTTRIQLFDADTGMEVQPEEDVDPGALYLLDGGSYRVVVDGETVREISVIGTGSETFRIGLPPSTPSDTGFLPGGGYFAPRL